MTSLRTPTCQSHLFFADVCQPRHQLLPVLSHRRHAKKLDQFHVQCLRKIANIKWQKRIPNTTVLNCSISGIEALLQTAHLYYLYLYLYCLTGSRFRRELCELFGCRSAADHRSGIIARTENRRSTRRSARRHNGENVELQHVINNWRYAPPADQSGYGFQMWR